MICYRSASWSLAFCKNAMHPLYAGKMQFFRRNKKHGISCYASLFYVSIYKAGINLFVGYFRKGI
jgi:hypothetical protein